MRSKTGREEERCVHMRLEQSRDSGLPASCAIPGNRSWIFRGEMLFYGLLSTGFGEAEAQLQRRSLASDLNRAHSSPLAQ